MTDLSVKLDVEDVTKFLTKLEKRQVPFATSRSLNDVAWAARQKLIRETPKHLRNPNPFTLRAFRVDQSTKRRLISRVFIAAKQWRYLRWQILGGTRRGPFITNPVNEPLNKYGNIKGLFRKKPRWQRGEPAGKQGTFVKTIGDTLGVWSRTKGKLVLLVAAIKSATYRKRLPFKKIARREVEMKFTGRFKKRIIEAIKTAKK